MSTQQFWINVAVKDIQMSKAFFRAIGFRENPMHASNQTCGSFFLDSNNTVMMLFTEDQMKTFIQHDVTDTQTSNEVLFNISANTTAEVDHMAEKVRAAGGVIYGEPKEVQGWMYAFGFMDPDGHRWCMMYMDMSKMPK